VIRREPPPGAVAPLPLWPTVAEAFRLMAVNFGTLAKIAVVPFILGLAIDFMVPFVSAPWSDVLRHLLFNVAWTLFGVSWLRLLLLEDRGAGRALPRLAGRHRRFLNYALLLFILDLPLILGWHLFADDPTTPQFPALTYWLFYVITVLVKLRFAFVFPAVAVDESYSLKLAWQHSRGPSLTLSAAIGLTVIAPVIGVSYAFTAVSLDAHVLLLAWLAWHLFTWLVEAIYLTVVAVAFRTSTGWVPAPDQRVLERFE
jgi:hypothetical protein